MSGFARARTPAVFLALLSSVLLLTSTSVAGDTLHYPNWVEFADKKTIELVTKNENGSIRKNPVWFVVMNDAAYLRTGGSNHWLRNLQREPDAVVNIGRKTFAVRAEEVEGPEIIQQVEEKLVAGYGRIHRIPRAKVTGTPRIVRLGPRE